MLNRAWTIALNTPLAAAFIWAAGGDVCLIRGAPASANRDVGAIAVGIAGQAISFILLYLLINVADRYGGFLKNYLSSPSLRAIGLLLPLLLAVFSHDPIAYGLYNAGPNEKIESARRADRALDSCCSPTRFLRLGAR